MSGPVYGTPGGGPVEPNGEWSVEQRLRAQAVRNLRRRAEFKVHLVSYALVNLLLIVIWLSVGFTAHVWYPWWIFPLFGWGIGLGIHAWTTYQGDAVNEQAIREEMKRITDG
jgi:hypothetical protein